MYIVLRNKKTITYRDCPEFLCTKPQAKKLQEFMSKNVPQTYTIYKLEEVK